MNDLKGKKLIVLKDKNLIDKILADVEYVTSLNTSVIIENSILQAILPKDKLFSVLIKKLYKNEINIKEILINVYEMLSEGIEVDIKYRNGINIVKYLRSVSCRNEIDIEKYEYESKMLIEQLESIVYILEENIVVDNIEERELKSEASFLRNYIKEIKEKSINIKIDIIQQYIYRNWWILKKYSRTYSILADITKLDGDIDETKENRYELIRVLKLISNEWE